MVLQHVQALALTKLYVAEKEMVETIKTLIKELLLGIVFKYLPLLI